MGLKLNGMGSGAHSSPSVQASKPKPPSLQASQSPSACFSLCVCLPPSPIRDKNLNMTLNQNGQQLLQSYRHGLSNSEHNSMPPYLHVSICPCLHISMPPYLASLFSSSKGNLLHKSSANPGPSEPDSKLLSSKSREKSHATFLMESNRSSEAFFSFTGKVLLLLLLLTLELAAAEDEHEDLMYFWPPFVLCSTAFASTACTGKHTEGHGSKQWQ